MTVRLRETGVLWAAVFILLAPALPASAQEQVTSDELIRNAGVYDAATIVYEGQAIGDIMERGAYAWVNVFDGDAAIGVWLTGRQASRISLLGRYGVQGDRLRVTGVFHRACREHGGDLDIHALDLAVVAPGKVIPRQAEPSKLLLAQILFFCLTLTWIYLRLKNKPKTS